jgi:hypothetical protein
VSSDDAVRFLRRVSAYHQAGHAVVAVKVGRVVTRTLVVSERDPQFEHFMGHTLTHQPEPVDDREVAMFPEAEMRRKEEIENEIRTVWAGALAESILLGDDYDMDLVLEEMNWTFGPPEGVDFPIIRDRCRDLTDNEDQAFARAVEFAESTREFLSRPDVWAAVDRVAEALLVSGELTGEQVEELVRPVRG